MGLPTTRDQTIASAGVIPSSVLNDLQDCIVGAKHPSIAHWQAVAGGTAAANSPFNAASRGYLCSVNTNVSTGVTDIPVMAPRVGTRITGFKFWSTVPGTSSTFWTRYMLNKFDPSGGKVALQTFDPAPVSAAPLTEWSFSLTTPYIMEDGKILLIDLAIDGINSYAGPFALVMDRL